MDILQKLNFFIGEEQIKEEGEGAITTGATTTQNIAQMPKRLPFTTRRKTFLKHLTKKKDDKEEK